jgi:hypothetical protein
MPILIWIPKVQTCTIILKCNWQNIEFYSQTKFFMNEIYVDIYLIILNYNMKCYMLVLTFLCHEMWWKTWLSRCLLIKLCWRTFLGNLKTNFVSFKNSNSCFFVNYGGEKRLHNNECFQLDSTSSSCSVLLMLRNWRKMIETKNDEVSLFIPNQWEKNCVKISTEKMCNW